MLQRQELTGDPGSGRLGRRWVTMSCDDEDDYDAMMMLACDVEDLHKNTSLQLLLMLIFLHLVFMCYF